MRRALPPPLPGAAALSDEAERRPGGCGAGQGSGEFLDDERGDGQMDGGQKPGLLVTSAPAAPDDDAWSAAPAQSPPVRLRRSRRDIRRRLFFAEDDDEKEEDDDEADAKVSEGSAKAAPLGLRVGETDLVRRVARGERLSRSASSSSSSSSRPLPPSRTASCRIGERQPTRIRPATKSSSAELIATPPLGPGPSAMCAANSKSTAAAAQQSASAEAAKYGGDAAPAAVEEGGERRM